MSRPAVIGAIVVALILGLAAVGGNFDLVAHFFKNPNHQLLISRSVFSQQDLQWSTAGSHLVGLAGKCFLKLGLLLGRWSSE